MKAFSILIFTLLTTSFSLFGGEDYFIEKGGFERAKLKAKEEGKMLFLDFYASWCTPCKWMDETTFKDFEIKSLLEQKYIAIKVNIDDFEGFELKSKFDIRYLPTILIFNHEGKMIERIEETIGTQKMKTMLKEHADSNAPHIKHKVNISPREAMQKNNEQNVSEQGISENQAQYRMQMGVFSTIESAASKSEELKSHFIEKISIIQQEKDGKVIYKVLLGEFSTIGEARSFKKILNEQFQMESVIF